MAVVGGRTSYIYQCLESDIRPYCVTNYGSGWRKDVVYIPVLEFDIRPYCVIYYGSGWRKDVVYIPVLGI